MNDFRNLINPLINFINLSGLHIGGGGNFVDQTRHGFDLIEDFFKTFSSVVGNGRSSLDFTDRPFNKLGRFSSGISRSGGQGSYFFGDYGESFTVLSGAGSFYSGVERENIGLECDVIDDLDDF